MIIASELIIPAREARYAPPPRWLTESPVWSAVQEDIGGELLYRHQAMAMAILGQERNLVISSGTASGKSLIFQAPTLHRLQQDPQARAIAIYPIKALSRDQLAKWRRMAATVGMDPNSINRIDGDIPATREGFQQRRELLRQTKLMITTPDIIHSWLLKYSNPPPPFAKSPAQGDVMESQEVIREFIQNLRMLVIDEAHTYDGAIGTSAMYLFQRLQNKVMLLGPGQGPVQIIAASATIRNPMEHLQTLTGQPFHEVTEFDNGAPKAELLVQHALGRGIYEGGWEDLAGIIKEILRQDPENRYIAFIDDRQLSERAAASIEEARGMTEWEIIRNAEESMSYRAGLMYREFIEELLREGRIRGLTSTSAMEMGIDICDLNIGMNLGVPTTIQRLRQRAGRVGRRTPGRFIIVADEYAFQFHRGRLEEYWNTPVEPARLYTNNPFIRNTHQRCLMMEARGERSLPRGEELPAIRGISQGKDYQPQFTTGNVKDPHRNQIRDAVEQSAVIVQAMPTGEEAMLTQETTIREAFKEAYPLATYYHSKQSYRVEKWERETDQDGERRRVIARQGPSVETRPIRESGADITLEEASLETGHLEYSSHENAETWERIVGCRVKQGHTWQNAMEINYLDQGIEDIEIRMRTTATTLVIPEPWFREPETRKRVAEALRDIMCSREGIHETDVRTSHENITLLEGAQERREEMAIVIWDRTGGGLGIARNVEEKLLEYAQGLLDIAQDPMERPESQKPLDQGTALRLHTWVQSYLEARQQRGIHPIISEYRGTTFRSQLEARWARHFDKQGVPWEYEPCTFGNWRPDFRLEIAGEALYAEVKPVDFFPEDVAENIDWSLWGGTAMILGNDARHRWLRRDGDWTRT